MAQPIHALLNDAVCNMLILLDALQTVQLTALLASEEPANIAIALGVGMNYSAAVKAAFKRVREAYFSPKDMLEYVVVSNVSF
jgi:hypothetical protein